MALQPNTTTPWVYTAGVNVSNWTPDTLGDVIDVYVNSVTGSDYFSGTVPATPFLTIMRALEASCFSLTDGITIRLNLAGASAHEISDGYDFPAIISSDAVGTIVSDLGFSKRCTLILQATPTLDATVPILAQANNANSGQKELTVAGLVIGAHDGKFAVDADNTIVRIRSNTATLILVDYAGADLVSPLRIYTEGATISPVNPASTSPTIVFLASTTSLGLNGVIVTSSAGGGLQLGPGQTCVAVGCTISDVSLGEEVNTNLQGYASAQFLACALADFSTPAGYLSLENCNIESGTIRKASPALRVSAAACSFLSMVSPLWTSNEAVPHSADLLQGSNLFVSSSVASGFLQSGGQLELTALNDVSSCGTAGIVVQNGAYAEIGATSSSAPNATYGLSVTSNAKVNVTGDTLLSGATNDALVQGLAAFSWAAFRAGNKPFNRTSLLTSASLYEDNGTEATPATATNTIAASQLIGVGNDFVKADTSGASVTLTLPLAEEMTGRKVTIFKPFAANSMILDGSGAEPINGAATKTTTDQYATLTVISDGTEWWIVSSIGTFI